MTSSTNKSCRNGIRRRIRSDHLLIWLDVNWNRKNENSQQTLEQFHRQFDEVYTFNAADECFDFVTDIESQKVFLIITALEGEQLVPLIHALPQLYAIYIICSDGERVHGQWTKEWSKIIDVHPEIESICKALLGDMKQYNRNSIPMSFIQPEENNSMTNLNQLEPSFMYTQLLKRALLEMKHDDQSRQYLITYWRHQYSDNPDQLKLVHEYESDTHPNHAIWWYTRECFAYEMINRALRLLEGDVIANMGFFLYILHQQIKELHEEQRSQYHGKSFTVYRGQGLSTGDFEKLKKTHDGLMSFNSFLSASYDMEVSLLLAESSADKFDTVGILFVMVIDPDLSSTPFANIQNVTYFEQERELLFSIHTVFRIGQIKIMDKRGRLVEVHLTLTADDDPQLQKLTDRLQAEIEDLTGWERVGNLLYSVGESKKAEELYLVLLGSVTNQDDEALYNHQLGCMKHDQGNYEEALRYYEKAIDLREKTLSGSQLRLAASYNNIGTVYHDMSDYSKALSFYEKAFDIRNIALSAHHPDLATSYSNLGLLYDNTGEYCKALSFHQKALSIYQIALPENHFTLATTYNNIASVHFITKEYSEAVAFFEKSIDIRQKVLPTYHPDLATSYSNIGLAYTNIGEYPKAVSFYEKARAIFEKAYRTNHPLVAVCYNNIGLMHSNVGEHFKALEFYEKAIDIRQKTLPTHHPDLATSYNNIGLVYMHIKEYSEALSFYEKARQIFEKASYESYPSLTNTYNNIGMVYFQTQEYTSALIFYKKVLDIRQKTLSADDRLLASAYNNIAVVYDSMGEYSNALLPYQSALSIKEKARDIDYLGLAKLYNNIGAVYDNMEEYPKALLFYEKAVDIYQTHFPGNQLDLATSCSSIGLVYSNMMEPSKALLFFEKAFGIYQETVPINQFDLANSYSNIGLAYMTMEEYSKALVFLEQAKDTGETFLSSEHQYLQDLCEMIDLAKQNL